MTTLPQADDTGKALFHPEQARRDAPSLRRFMLAIVIVLCVALPRAGFVIHALRVPLPYSVIAVYVIFIFVLPFRPVQRYAHYLPAFFLFCGCILVASYIGLLRHALYRVVLVEVATIVGQLPVFFIVIHLVRKPEDIDFALKWLLASLLFASIYGIAQFYKGTDVIVPGVTYTAGSEFSLVQIARPGAERRVLSSYGDPNVLGGALVLFIPVLLGLLITHEGRGQHWWQFISVVGTITMSLLLLVYCNSRAGYIGTIVAAGLLLWKFKSRFLTICLPFLLLLWIVVELGLAERVIQRAEIAPGDPRWKYAALSLELALSHPEGTGLGVHVQRSANDDRFHLLPAQSIWWTYNSYYMHLLVRTGFVGLGAFLFLCYRFVQMPWEYLKMDSLDLRRPIVAGFLAGFVGVQLAMLVNPFYQLPGGGINVWLSLGLANAIVRTGSQTD